MVIGMVGNVDNPRFRRSAAWTHGDEPVSSVCTNFLHPVCTAVVHSLWMALSGGPETVPLPGVPYVVPG